MIHMYSIHTYSNANKEAIILYLYVYFVCISHACQNIMYLQTSHFIHKKEIEKEKKKKGNLIQIPSLIPCIGIVELEEYKHVKTSTYTNGPYHLLNQKKKKKKTQIGCGIP